MSIHLHKLKTELQRREWSHQVTSISFLLSGSCLYPIVFKKKNASSPQRLILLPVLWISPSPASSTIFLGQLPLTAIFGCFPFLSFEDVFEDVFPFFLPFLFFLSFEEMQLFLRTGIFNFFHLFKKQPPRILHPSFNYSTTSFPCAETSGKSSCSVCSVTFPITLLLNQFAGFCPQSCKCHCPDQSHQWLPHCQTQQRLANLYTQLHCRLWHCWPLPP